MNRALWIKAIADAWRQFVVSFALLMLFSWLFVWLMSRFPTGGFGTILNLLPGFVQSLVGVPLAMLSTPVGQLSILYVHIVTLLICVGWALGRGSDSITGEISRGTMDLILTLPIWRVSVVLIPAAVSAAGAILLAAAVMLGTWLGLACVHFDTPIHVSEFLPGAVNLACMIFCFTGITTMISAGMRDRWMAFAISGGLYVVELVIKLVARMWPEGKWLFNFTFLTAFEPQEMILTSDPASHVALRCNLTLLTLGVASYAVAIVIFNRRDIPGPR
jgi:ABC-2 type transport system permease protein